MLYTKIRGAGGEYVCVYGEVPWLSDITKEAPFAASDRVAYISPSAVADFKLTVSGGEGDEPCGSGLRCAAKYVYDRGYTDKKNMTVETSSGIKSVTVNTVYGKTRSVSVSMGKAVASDCVAAAGGKVIFTPVHVGRIYYVCFTEDGFPVDNCGFDGGTVLTAVAEDSETLVIKGKSDYCSAACACVSAAAKRGLVDPYRTVTVKTDGGELKVRTNTDGEATVEGAVEFVCEGET